MNYSFEITDEKVECIREVNKEKEINIKNENIEPTVGKFHDAPHFLRDNEFIHSGYRINFNSKWKIFKSLFVLHNEFVNVWSHLLGALFVVMLIIYTSLYIKSHKSEIINAIDHKLDSFNEEWSHSDYLGNFTADIMHTLEGGKEFIHVYSEKFKNKTTDYIYNIDEKLSEYKKYLNEQINCIECIEVLKNKISQIKEKFNISILEIKDQFTSLLKTRIPYVNISNYEFDISNYLEEINDKFHKFKEEIMEKLDSKDMEWIDLYKSESKKNNTSKIRRWPLFVFLISAIICLGCSATFHLCYVHSEQMSSFLGRLDYAGISFLIAGSCFPPYYYLFFCSTNFMILYLTCISTFALIVLICSFSNKFGESKNRKFRGLLFLTLGVSAGLPILHLALFPHTIIGNISSPTLMNWLLGGFSYILGCSLYINRFPEKFWPGRFCIWGSSHQIWHFMVFSGVLFHFFASLDSYYDRIAQGNYCY